MPLSAEEERYWQRYLQGLSPSERPPAPVVTAARAGGPAMADVLLRLYLEGTKTAGSSLLEDFQATGDPVPQVGDHWIVLGGDGAPGCILRTVSVVVHLFDDVPESVAIAEGEGDLSLAHWKRVHAQLYAPHLEAWGLSAIDEATVVTEFFRVVLH